MARNIYSERRLLIRVDEFKIGDDPPILSDREFSPLQFELGGSCPILNLGININV
jgi:hypothetical protein